MQLSPLKSQNGKISQNHARTWRQFTPGRARNIDRNDKRLSHKVQHDSPALQFSPQVLPFRRLSSKIRQRSVMLSSPVTRSNHVLPVLNHDWADHYTKPMEHWCIAKVAWSSYYCMTYSLRRRIGGQYLVWVKWWEIPKAITIVCSAIFFPPSSNNNIHNNQRIQ